MRVKIGGFATCVKTPVKLLGRARQTVRKLQKAKPRVMLYKSPSDNIGDMLLLSGVTPQYRELFKGATLELLCKDESAPLMRELGGFDAVWPMSALSRNRKPRWTNAGRVDTLISLRRTPSPADQMWLESFQPAKTAGFSRDVLTHRTGRQPSYLDLLDWDCALQEDNGASALHELGAQQKMLALLGRDVPVEELRPRLPVSYADFSAAELLERHGLISGHCFYVCCPYGSSAIRSYSPEKWREVFAALAPCAVAVCAAGGDWADALSLTAPPMPGMTVINMAGQTTLPQLAGLMLRANAVLAVDSGPMHMAVALGRPVVGVCGRGHYGRFVPYPYAIPNARFLFGDCDSSGCGWECPQNAESCIKSISTREIAQAARDVAFDPKRGI